MVFDVRCGFIYMKFIKSQVALLETNVKTHRTVMNMNNTNMDGYDKSINYDGLAIYKSS